MVAPGFAYGAVAVQPALVGTATPSWPRRAGTVVQAAVGLGALALKGKFCSF